MDTEAVRARYRPYPIATLFVGEAPPASGKFFYLGNSALAHHMEAAMMAAGVGGGDGNFLNRFKERGWYLDDLVLEPVDRLQTSERRRKWRNAGASLADRINDYQPRAIVSLLLGIKDVVNAAAKAAGSEAQLFAVPFPGMGQQARFRQAIAQIMPQLPYN